MKNILLFLFLLCTLHFSLFTFPTPISAHMIGQPPFFKVDGQYSPYYPVPTTSLPDFNLPQDIAPKNFTVGEKIDFEIDAGQLPAPSEIIQKTHFSWDFGDGKTNSGLKNSHSYSKSGSYILTIKADDGSGVGPQSLQSIMVNVLPDKNFQLPKAVIVVNGWMSRDPLADILEDKFDKDYKFDGTKSDAGSTKVVEYAWDFGDGNSARGPKVSHRYTNNPYTVFPVLRIKTADGFTADSFVKIKDSGGFTSNPKEAVKDTLSDDKITKQPNLLRYALVGVGILVGIYIIAWIILRMKRRY